MSQEMRTVFVSSGLMVGLNIAPPPPGPMMRKSPGRSAARVDAHTATRIAGRKRNFIGPCLDDDECRRHKTTARVQRAWKRPPRQLGFHDKGGRFPRRGELERDPQPETNGATAIDTLLGVSVRQDPELDVQIHLISRDIRFEGCGVDADTKIAQIRKRPTAASVVGIRREQAMVENVLNVGAQRCRDAFSEAEILMES